MKEVLTITKQVDAWSQFCDVKPSSRETYRKALKQFAQFVGDGCVDRDTVMRWRDTMLKTHQATTVQTYLVAVKVFFKWLAAQGLGVDVTQGVKPVKLGDGHKRDALSESQAQKLLSMTANVRDRAMLALMLTTGLRTIEVVRADKKDLRCVDGVVVLSVQGKGRDDKTEFVTVDSRVAQLIQQYIDSRCDDSDALFVSQSNRNQKERITTKTVRMIVKNYLIKAGYNSDRLSAHSLRHTAATIALKQGASIYNVRQYLRHKNLNTVLIYLHDLDRLQNPCSNLVTSRILGGDD